MTDRFWIAVVLIIAGGVGWAGYLLHCSTMAAIEHGYTQTMLPGNCTGAVWVKP